jgi:hypothetical protein
MILYFDFGDLCPDFLPAHAHNDMLSYSLLFNGEEFATDSGVFEYKKGEWRNWFRSGRAHNSLMIDSKEPNDIWGSFRVGKRGHPYNFRYLENEKIVLCSHDSYRDVGVEITRSIKLLPEIPGIMVTDIIANKKKHHFEEYIHVAPGYRKSDDLSENGISSVELRKGNSIGTIVLDRMSNLQESWYAPEFGIMKKRICVCLSGTTVVPKCYITYFITALPMNAARMEYERILNSSEKTIDT